MRSWHRGFTLVEVLVALAVLAIALAAIMRTMAQAIDTTAALREHDVALWVAQSRLAEHMMRKDWPGTDTANGDAEMGGQKWFGANRCRHARAKMRRITSRFGEQLTARIHRPAGRLLIQSSITLANQSFRP
jgi:general secretion pathway protein I